MSERLRIGVYALAKNEAANVPRWEESCRDADVRVVTDTGSTDGTPGMLRERGVTVREAFIVPWRWDDAHNASMQGLPPDVDICIRLDLDEALSPGWREVVEREWTAGTTRLKSRYEWAPGQVIWGDRIHARSGFRWRAATHEWLHAWDGSPQGEKEIPNLTHIQRRPEGKKHAFDRPLLEVATREDPSDARALWYLARELGFEKDAGELELLDRYLAMPGGSYHERCAAFRRLAILRPNLARLYLLDAIKASPQEPEAYISLAADCQQKGDFAGALHYASFALQAPAAAENHASDSNAYGTLPAEIGAQAAIILGLQREAIWFVKEGLRRKPDHPELIDLLDDLSSPPVNLPAVEIRKDPAPPSLLSRFRSILGV